MIIGLFEVLCNRGKNGQQFVTFSLFFLHLFGGQPIELGDDFQPILRFAGLALTYFDLVSEISFASGSIRLAIVGPNGGGGFDQLLSYDSSLEGIG